MTNNPSPTTALSPKFQGPEEAVARVKLEDKRHALWERVHCSPEQQDDVLACPASGKYDRSRKGPKKQGQIGPMQAQGRCIQKAARRQGGLLQHRGHAKEERK